PVICSHGLAVETNTSAGTSRILPARTSTFTSRPSFRIRMLVSGWFSREPPASASGALAGGSRLNGHQPPARRGHYPAPSAVSPPVLLLRFRQVIHGFQDSIQ